MMTSTNRKTGLFRFLNGFEISTGHFLCLKASKRKDSNF